MLMGGATALQLPSTGTSPPAPRPLSRRAFGLLGPAAAALPFFLRPLAAALAAEGGGGGAAALQFSTAASGLQWADAKTGSGSPPQPGAQVVVDYVMSTTGARYTKRKTSYG